MAVYSSIPETCASRLQCSFVVDGHILTKKKNKTKQNYEVFDKFYEQFNKSEIFNDEFYFKKRCFPRFSVLSVIFPYRGNLPL